MSYHEFNEDRITAIRPSGWLKRWLEIQRHGLTGHLEAAGFPFDTKLWACKEIPAKRGVAWWPYEQTAYWVDGFTRTGLLLRDPELTAKAREQVEYVLEHADRDGYLGPKNCKAPMPAGRWSHGIFFRAMIAWYYATGDERIVTALRRHYLESAFDHSGHRDICNIEIMCWVYEHVGDKRLLDMAEEAWKTYQETGTDDDAEHASARLRAKRPIDSHGVTFLETIKQPALLYLFTGKRAHLRDALNGFRKLDIFHMLPSGAPSSTEHLRGTTSLDAHETCDIADYLWSAGYMLFATGDALFADKVELAAFNALPGAVTKDFKALQYFSGSNQVVLARNSNHTLAATGKAWMCYRPRPGTECCTGQVHRVIPNYVARMWLRRDDDPAAALYGPGSYSFEVKNGRTVTIHEETCYPFSDEIDFTVEADRPARFTLWLRIPRWCRTASITKNGVPMRIKAKPGTFVAVRDTFEPNDRIRLKLPMPLELRHWPDGGITVERGPLLFALPIEGRRTRDHTDKNQTDEFPSWEMHPESVWNYALCLDDRNLEQQVSVRYGPMTLDPWEHPPISLTVPARRVKGWRLRRAKRLPSVGGRLIDAARNKWLMEPKTVKGDFLITPPLPEPSTLPGRLGAKPEQITLVPYGSTLLRVAMFPQAPTR